MNIVVYVERVVIDEGVARGLQPSILLATVQAELARLLTDAGLAAASDVAVPTITAPALQISSGGSTPAVGRALASSVFDGISNVTSAGDPNNREMNRDV